MGSFAFVHTRTTPFRPRMGGWAGCDFDGVAPICAPVGREGFDWSVGNSAHEHPDQWEQGGMAEPLAVVARCLLQASLVGSVH